MNISEAKQKNLVWVEQINRDPTGISHQLRLEKLASLYPKAKFYLLESGDTNYIYASEIYNQYEIIEVFENELSDYPARELDLKAEYDQKLKRLDDDKKRIENLLNIAKMKLNEV